MSTWSRISSRPLNRTTPPGPPGDVLPGGLRVVYPLPSNPAGKKPCNIEIQFGEPRLLIGGHTECDLLAAQVEIGDVAGGLANLGRQGGEGGRPPTSWHVSPSGGSLSHALQETRGMKKLLRKLLRKLFSNFMGPRLGS